MPYKDKSKDTARLRKWRADNPERVKEIDAKNRTKRKSEGTFAASKRSAHLKREYGITLADYEIMHERQQGRCAICKRLPEKGKLLLVDHDHKSNMVRGLLCHHCNLMLGHAKDNTSILAAGITYLTKGV